MPLLWKLSFQKSIERRDITKSPRPVMLWQDEGQFFLLPATDFLFTSTSRSARVANVLLTQSISGVMATLGGGPAGKAEADAYLSNYGTKVLHANTDPASNEYAANLIGRCKQFVIRPITIMGAMKAGRDFRGTVTRAAVPASAKSWNLNCSRVSSRNYAPAAPRTRARWTRSSSRMVPPSRRRAATG